MMRTKRRFDKMGGIIGFHAFQSFAKGEVTPELAHKIGVELANELWGDRFEVVVTTHLNTNCIHNHFCLNSVSFKDGKKFYDTLESYALMRETSDRLCEEYKLSVIKEILPEELSKYFFFDGERINRMSTEINKGKSSDFADAVESLLGLKPLKQLINHMKPTSSTSVIGKFDEEIDSNGDQRSRELSEEIHNLNEKIEQDNNRLIEIEE